MNDAPTCPVCDGSLFAGRCLACDTRRWSGLVHREVVILALLAGVTVVAFFVTRAVAVNNEALRRQQAATWFEAADGELRGGRIEPAVVALRRAVTKDPENREYRLALADALAESGRDDEAQRALLTLREALPEDPETNLQLARLDARRDDTDAARRYYQNAVAGLWRPEQTDELRRVRLELIDFLVAQGQRARALSELLVAAANLPDDVAIQIQVGRRFLDAGDPGRALEQFRVALGLDPDSGPGLAGAGEASFELGDYAGARRYLGATPPGDARLDELREVTDLVLTGDPLAARLGTNERRRRLLVALDQATRRLDACLGDPTVDLRAVLAPMRTELRRFHAATAAPQPGESRDLIDGGVDLIYRAEHAVEQVCRTPEVPFDRALLLIGRRHGFEEQ